ncbi:MAG: MarR family transcriptional regulator [Planctomycetota bacterium]
MKLQDTEQQFILHWGEMGTKWGINRSVAQIHALLYISPEPLNAEEIADTLSVARSNVSTSLRELQGWRLVRVSHQLGDRRDYFSTFSDTWEMFRVVMDERKKREIDPTIAVLRDCVAASKGRKASAHTHQKLTEMLEFVDTVSGWYEQVSALPQASFLRFARAGSKIGQLFGLSTSGANKSTGRRRK